VALEEDLRLAGGQEAGANALDLVDGVDGGQLDAQSL
jgi:hypothetical protein